MLVSGQEACLVIAWKFRPTNLVATGDGHLPRRLLWIFKKNMKLTGLNFTKQKAQPFQFTQQGCWLLGNFSGKLKKASTWILVYGQISVTHLKGTLPRLQGWLAGSEGWKKN